MTRRDALMSGLTAALGLPLALKETHMIDTTAVSTIPVPAAPRGETLTTAIKARAITPCHPKNDARMERLTILVHNLRDEIRLVGEEHGEDCDCEACDVGNGMAWILGVVESCLDGSLVSFWHFWQLDPGTAANVADAARRLDLPLNMVENFVAYHSPKSHIGKQLVDEYNRERSESA